MRSIAEHGFPGRVLLGQVSSNLSKHRVFFSFSGASTAYSLTGMFSGLVVLRWLDPGDVGLWHSLLIIETYTLLFQLGVFKGLARELPFRLGVGDASAPAFASTAQALAMVGAGILALAGVCLPFMLDRAPATRIGLAVVLLGSAASLVDNYLVVTYRSNRSFDLLARNRWVVTAATLVTLPVVYFFGYIGLVARYFALKMCTVALDFISRPLRVPTSFSVGRLTTLLRVGLPIFVFAYLTGVGRTFPRLILLSAGGAELVGMYAPAAAALGVIVLLPQTISHYVSPRMAYRFGRSGEPKSLWPMAWKTGMGFLAFSIPVIIAGILSLPTLVSFFLPRYVDSIPAMRWTMIAGGFAGASIADGALRSLKAWRWMLVLTVVRLGSAYLGPAVAATTMASPLEGVGCGFMLAEAVSFVAAMGCVFAATHSPRYAVESSSRARLAEGGEETVLADDASGPSL